MIKKDIKKESGYTIIETMIAISLFIIIVMAGMGALLNANALHQKSRDMSSILDNLSFVMEDMSRNLRTGYNYRCYDVAGLIITSISVPKSCIVNPNGWAIAFEASGGNPLIDSDQWAYYIDNGKIFRSENGGVSFVQITPDEIIIDESYAFTVVGAEPPTNGDTKQPFVTIKLVGEIKYKDIITPFSLQTSVSQRQIDI